MQLGKELKRALAEGGEATSKAQDLFDDMQREKKNTFVLGKEDLAECDKLEAEPEITCNAVAAIMEGIKVEQDSAQIYEAMSAVADKLGYKNTSKWFKTHAAEERKHSDWVISFLEDKNVCPELPEISKPEQCWPCVKTILAEAYKHERFVTAFWNKAATACLAENDHDAYQFCLRMLQEQREEIELFSGLLDMYNLTEGDSQLTFDKHMIHP